MKEGSEANCINGSFGANDICRNYRREGVSIDEILDQATSGNNEEKLLNVSY